jgi:hypothetical protein
VISAWNGVTSMLCYFIFSIGILFMFKCNVFMEIICCPSQYTRKHDVPIVSKENLWSKPNLLFWSTCSHFILFWEFVLSEILIFSFDSPLCLYYCCVVSGSSRYLIISASLGYSINGLNVLYVYFYSIRIVIS